MLDKLFLKYLSQTGKKAYWIGQISAIALILIYFLGISGYSLRDAQNFIILSGIVTIVAWGLICLFIWPRSQDENKKINTSS